MVDHPDPDRGTVHTPGEIAQQPEMWRQTARLVRDRAPALKRFLEAAGLYSDEIPSRILLTGAGTSHYVGLSVVDLLRRRFDTPCESRPTTRITPNPDLFFREGGRPSWSTSLDPATARRAGPCLRGGWNA